MNIIFWAIVAIDAALFTVIVVTLGMQAGNSSGGREMGIFFYGPVAKAMGEAVVSGDSAALDPAVRVKDPALLAALLEAGANPNLGAPDEQPLVFRWLRVLPQQNLRPTYCPCRPCWTQDTEVARPLAQRGD